ncbi:MAG: hypothetical protein M3Z24_09600 [Chloroflexota bacterium]|nr:hypothetical protein [Chloroflexota bacterium]
MDWDAVREIAPFLVGMFLPPLLMFVIRPQWSGLLKFAGAFAPALLLGIVTSAWAGELALGMPDALIAVIIDTSLVYAGSQLAYRLFWKPVVLVRLQRSAVSRMEKVQGVSPR